MFNVTLVPHYVACLCGTKRATSVKTDDVNYSIHGRD